MTDEDKLKQIEYITKRRIQAMKLGVDQSLHGMNNVSIFSRDEFWPGDEKWAAVHAQANRVLSEVMTLQILFEMIVGHTPDKSGE